MSNTSPGDDQQPAAVRPPLSLYIHVPWCVRKCPYCDFNSHAFTGTIPESAYLQALLEDLDQDLAFAADRPIETVFIGGGTPSLMSGAFYHRLFERLRVEYDVLVIDTGPILGSIEAQAIVPASDEVLLVVSRGRDVRHVRMAIERLQRLGARRLGIVFNRAASSDFERSTSMSMASARVSQPTTARAELLHGMADTANGHTGNRAG